MVNKDDYICSCEVSTVVTAVAWLPLTLLLPLVAAPRTPLTTIPIRYRDVQCAGFELWSVTVYTPCGRCAHVCRGEYERWAAFVT